MIASRPTTSPSRPARRGFTLVEMMIVIVIITILLALLVPAIRGAITRARDAQVRAEITRLETAIGAFKARYGVEPPSSITLCTTATEWNNNVASKAFIRRIWPQFDFTGSGGGGWSQTTLNGSQCLVFFLGGVYPAGGAPVGFSKNPGSPFSLGGSRDGPFFEFDSGRFDTNTFRTYRDPLPNQNAPYIYLSSYDGQGYQAAEADAQDDGNATNNSFTFYHTGNTASPYKPNSFQIISPGSDGWFGAGGVYDANTESPGNRQLEWDNITNFSSLRLWP